MRIRRLLSLSALTSWISEKSWLEIRCRSALKRRGREERQLVFCELVVDDRGDGKRENHGDQQAADHRNREGLQHLGAGSRGKCEGEHASYGGDGDGRPLTWQTSARGLRF